MRQIKKKFIFQVPAVPESSWPSPNRGLSRFVSQLGSCNCIHSQNTHSSVNCRASWSSLKRSTLWGEQMTCQQQHPPTLKSHPFTYSRPSQKDPYVFCMYSKEEQKHKGESVRGSVMPLVDHSISFCLFTHAQSHEP